MPEEIGFDVLASPLGLVLVAGTARGVRAVYLGDDAEELERELRAQFPDANVAHAPERVAPWADEVLRRTSGLQAERELPLDLSGTPFQMEVWRALEEIPFGETRSYREVANAVGQPTAARAVASACAANNVALLVPCHRVVYSNGTLSGYRWGAARKRKLLADEAGSRG